MTIALTIVLPSLASIAVWGAIILATNAVTWQVCRIVNDRSWEADVRRRAAWCFRSPHLHAGEANIIERPSPGIATFKVRRFETEVGSYSDAA